MNMGIRAWAYDHSPKFMSRDDLWSQEAERGMKAAAAGQQQKLSNSLRLKA